jgi:3-methylfumaryl-CoA hydratase
MSVAVKSSLSTADLDRWRAHIGRSESRHQILDLESLRRYAVSVGASPEVEHTMPPLAHWAFFVDTVDHTMLGTDGHPQRGLGLLPPVTLERRMFAGSVIRLDAPLAIDRPARLTLTLQSLEHKVGSSGDLVFLELHRVLSQDGVQRVLERQTIVYRDRAAPIDPVIPSGPSSDAAEEWLPSTVDLFRFSASTFNAHRIHYDLPYARGVEGYPELVVQGPLIAAKLYAFSQCRSPKPLAGFSFRLLAPLFVNQPVRFRTHPTDGNGTLEAVRCDGVVAVSARAVV